MRRRAIPRRPPRGLRFLSVDRRKTRELAWGYSICRRHALPSSCRPAEARTAQIVARLVIAGLIAHRPGGALKILVSGSTGFIGSSLVPKLREQRHDVAPLVRPSTRAPSSSMQG